MGEPAPAGRVVDQAVLAERRARRAELAEQAAARRAEDAERRLIATRAELAELEARVQWLTADREAAEGRLVEQQRALRQSAQRLHAEQRRREELVDEVADRADQAEAEARELRTRLDEVERSAARMDAQLEELRRRTAESENALAAALAARRRSEREAADAVERLQALQAPREDECREQARWLAEAEQGLGLAHETIIQARLRLDELERTCDELRRETETERAVRHSLQAEMAEAREATAAAEREAVELRRELAERVTLQEGAREVIDDLEHRLAALATEVAGRDAHAEEDRRRLGEVTAAAHDALEVAERRIGESLRAAGEVQRQLEHERALRQAVEEELAKAIGARAAAERESQRRSEEHARAQRTVHELRAELRRLRARTPSATARDHPPTADASQPWVARGLALMVRDDPDAAARLLLQLLPGQGLNAGGRMDYDLGLAGAGLHAVSCAPGAAAAVRELREPRPDREVDFRLELDAAGLLTLITGRRTRRRRGPRMRVRATRRRRRALRTFPAVKWSLGELARAGVWVDPCLAYRALTYLIEPGWTRGHSFCIAHEVMGPSPEPWYVHVRDGTLPEVTRTPPPEGPTATVRLTQAAFQARLDDESPTPDGEHKPAIRGDVRSFSALAQWTEWARGIGAPPTD